jgi:UTP--glucose-1-phosphate uridylyltransferase
MPFGTLCAHERDLRHPANQKPGYGGEGSLPTGENALPPRADGRRRLRGKRFDTGNLCGFLEATLAFALDHPETGPWLREYLKTL